MAVEVSRALGALFGIRRYRHRYPSGDPGAARPAGTVAIVGGGVAGISAAVVLAERGVDVTVFEAGARLGGRLSSVETELGDGTVQAVDHGFHGFFRQYYNWRAVLSRIDADGRLLRPLDDYPVISTRWPAEQFDRLPPSPPLSLAALVLRSPSLRLGQLRRTDRELARQLLSFDPVETYRRLDGVTAESFLTRLGLSERARSMLFNVFAHSFFNHASAMSAAELVAMFHFYFLGNPEGLGMDAPRGDHHTAIWEPLRRYVEDRGSTVRTETRAERFEPEPDGSWRLLTSSGEVVCDRLVLAVDAASAAGLLARCEAVTAADPRLADAVARPLTAAPYAVARFWLDGDVASERSLFTSIGDAALLDSVTLYHRVDPRAGAWRRRTGGAVVELHAYACPEGPSADELGTRMLEELRRLWPETAGLRAVERRCRTGADAAGFPPGRHHRRPRVRSTAGGLLCAGDWIASPVPGALMERAATTGVLAANAVLAESGLPTEPVWSVPLRGLLAPRPSARSARRAGAAGAQRP